MYANANMFVWSHRLWCIFGVGIGQLSPRHSVSDANAIPH